MTGRRAPCTFRQADVTRALKAARAAGFESVRVEIDRDGKIAIVDVDGAVITEQIKCEPAPTVSVRQPPSPYGRSIYSKEQLRAFLRDGWQIDQDAEGRVLVPPVDVQGRSRRKKRRISDHVDIGEATRKPKLYVIRAATTTQFKIGIAQDPDSRLRAMQVGSPVSLELIVAVEILRPEIEREAHRVLAAWRTHGEWFDLGPLADYFTRRVQRAAVENQDLLAVLCEIRSDAIPTTFKAIAAPPSLPPQQNGHDEASAERANGGAHPMTESPP